MIEQTIEGQHHRYLYTIEEVSKILRLQTHDNKFIGRNNLFKVLRYNKIITATNLPIQSWIILDLMVVHTTTKRWKTYPMVTFTEKGIDYLKNGFLSGKYICHYEKTKRKPKLTVELKDVC